MDDAFTTPASTGLQTCPACERPFVIPLSVLDVVDGDRCVIELQCTSCGDTRIAVHTDAELEGLERDLVASREQIRGAIELLEVLEEWERAERFIEALHDDLVVPDDF